MYGHSRQRLFAPAIIPINKEQVLDFGSIREGDYSTPVYFEGYVGPHEAVRYLLRIEAENFISPTYVIEVAWDGQWSRVPDEMKRHLPIRFVTQPAPQ